MNLLLDDVLLATLNCNSALVDLNATIKGLLMLLK